MELNQLPRLSINTQMVKDTVALIQRDTAIGPERGLTALTEKRSLENEYIIALMSVGS